RFFFSSRRRHTSSKRDWSSDVCSSDLYCIDQLVENNCGLFFSGARSGLITNSVNTAVHTVAFDLVDNLFSRIAVVKIDWFGTELFGQIQPVLYVVDHKDTAGAFQLCRISGHQPDRSCAIQRNRFTGLNSGQLSCVIAGGENIGQHGEVFFVLITLWQLHTVVISKWDPQVFGLATGIGPHTNIPVCATSGSGIINRQTERRFTSPAIITESTGHIEGHDHSVSLRYRGHSGANFFDNPHVFVAKGDTRLGISTALIHVQVRTADSS